MAIKNNLIIISSLILLLAIALASLNPSQSHQINEIGNTVFFGSNQLTGKILQSGATAIIDENVQISQINYLDTKKTMNIHGDVTYSNSNLVFNMQCCIDGNCKTKSSTNIIENTLLCNQNGNFPAYFTAYTTSEGLIILYERTLKLADFYNDAGGIFYQPWQ